MSGAALSLEHVRVAFGDRVVIDDASVEFARGSVTAVVGRSGAGKSVLMKAAAGLLARSSGRVVVGAPPLVFVHQDPALLDDLDVLQNVALPARASGRPRDPLPWLARLKLTETARLLPQQLSPSQARRAALVRALLLEPGVLIVDEPTTGLDPVASDDVDEALADVADVDRAVIVITHHPRTLRRLLSLPRSRVLVVDGGRVAAGAVA